MIKFIKVSLLVGFVISSPVMYASSVISSGSTIVTSDQLGLLGLDVRLQEEISKKLGSGDFRAAIKSGSYSSANYKRKISDIIGTTFSSQLPSGYSLGPGYYSWGIKDNIEILDTKFDDETKVTPVPDSVDYLSCNLTNDSGVNQPSLRCGSESKTHAITNTVTNTQACSLGVEVSTEVEGEIAGEGEKQTTKLSFGISGSQSESQQTTDSVTLNYDGGSFAVPAHTKLMVAAIFQHSKVDGSMTYRRKLKPPFYSSFSIYSHVKTDDVGHPDWSTAYREYSSSLNDDAPKNDVVQLMALSGFPWDMSEKDKSMLNIDTDDNSIIVTNKASFKGGGRQDSSIIVTGCSIEPGCSSSGDKTCPCIDEPKLVTKLKVPVIHRIKTKTISKGGANNVLPGCGDMFVK